MIIDKNKLKNAERILRVFLASLLAMTAIYKIIIGGQSLVEFYEPQFAGNPYGLSSDIIGPFLYFVGPLELVIAVSLLINQLRDYALYIYFGLLIVLMFGHFALSEFHEVNGLFDYMLGGLLIYVLPKHPNLFYVKNAGKSRINLKEQPVS